MLAAQLTGACDATSWPIHVFRSHRCSVGSFVAKLISHDMPAAGAVIGMPDAVPKHWVAALAVGGGGPGRSAAELRAFLVNEVAEATGVEAATVAEDQGLVFGVSSIWTVSDALSSALHCPTHVSRWGSTCGVQHAVPVRVGC